MAEPSQGTRWVVLVQGGGVPLPHTCAHNMHSKLLIQVAAKNRLLNVRSCPVKQCPQVADESVPRVDC